MADTSNEAVQFGKEYVILLAEDNPINQILTRTILERNGLRAVVVNTGREAVERHFSGNGFDLILMDMQMPEMNGVDAAREIRLRENGKRQVPIIALTAASMKGDREKCLEAGMNEYLTKPLRPKELVLALKKYLA